LRFILDDQGEQLSLSQVCSQIHLFLIDSKSMRLQIETELIQKSSVRHKRKRADTVKSEMFSTLVMSMGKVPSMKVFLTNLPVSRLLKNTRLKVTFAKSGISQKYWAKTKWLLKHFPTLKQAFGKLVKLN